ncbi:MAG: hypothetical protein OXK82_10660 [Deltaproteobacteria bacterium]|nr:hypothetical protein [Deltaproteobacteria bacterium]
MALAIALVAIPPAIALDCGDPAAEGSVYAVYVTCEPELVFVPFFEGPGGVPHKELSPAYRTPPPETDWFNVACTDPVAAGLPDDVLTECEGEFTGH